MLGKRWVLDAHGGPDGLHLVDFDVQTPSADEVLIKVLATTATYTDQMIMRGTYSPSPPLPLTPGYDCIGVVEALGSDVSKAEFIVGDRVACMPQAHCMATHILLPCTAVVKIPFGDPLEQVTCIRTGVTAYQMLYRCCANRIEQPKECKMLIHGAAGATGSFLLSLALSAGFSPKNIFGTCSKKNLSVLGAFGVNALDYEEDWSKTVLSVTQGKGVDLIFDAVCIRGYFDLGMKCLANSGKYVSYGFTHNQASESGNLPIPEVLFFFTKQTLQQCVCSWFDGREAEFYIISDRRKAKPEEFKADLLEIFRLAEEKALVLPTGRTWAFSRCKDALLGIANNEHTGIQIIKMDATL